MEVLVPWLWCHVCFMVVVSSISHPFLIHHTFPVKHFHDDGDGGDGDDNYY